MFSHVDNRQLCVKEEQKANGCIQQTNGKEPLRQYNMPLDSVSMLNSNWAKEDGHCTNCHLADHGLDTDEDMTQPKISKFTVQPKMSKLLVLLVGNDIFKFK